MNRLVEIRSYKLKSSTRERFHELVATKAVDAIRNSPGSNPA